MAESASISQLLSELKQSLCGGRHEEARRPKGRHVADLRRVYSVLIHGAPSFRALAFAPVVPLLAEGPALLLALGIGAGAMTTS